MDALKRKVVRGALIFGLVAAAPVAGIAQEYGSSTEFDSLREAAQRIYTQGDFAIARQLAVLAGDYALEKDNVAEAAAAYLDAAWIALRQIGIGEKQARHPTLAMLRLGETEPHKKRKALVEEAKRLVSVAQELSDSGSLAARDRDIIDSRLAQFGQLALID
jgi:hypothetical protein